VKESCRNNIIPFQSTLLKITLMMHHWNPTNLRHIFQKAQLKFLALFKRIIRFFIFAYLKYLFSSLSQESRRPKLIHFSALVYLICDWAWKNRACWYTKFDYFCKCKNVIYWILNKQSCMLLLGTFIFKAISVCYCWSNEAQLFY